MKLPQGKNKQALELALEKPLSCAMKSASITQVIQFHPSPRLTSLPGQQARPPAYHSFPLQPHLRDFKWVQRPWKWKSGYTKYWGGNRYWEKLRQGVCQAFQSQFHRACAFQMLFIYSLNILLFNRSSLVHKPEELNLSLVPQPVIETFKYCF